MQNKANLRKNQMNVTVFGAKAYVNLFRWRARKNKANLEFPALCRRGRSGTIDRERVGGLIRRLDAFVVVRWAISADMSI